MSVIIKTSGSTAPPKITNITLIPDGDIYLVKNKSTNISFFVLPVLARNNVALVSNNTDLATIGTVSGVLTANSTSGNLTISAYSTDGGNVIVNKNVTVVDTEVKITSISLNNSSVYMSKNETLLLTATISPSNSTEKNLNWVSSNTNIATVDNRGVVKYIGTGNCTITASAKDGSGISSSCTINERILVSSISLNYTTTTTYTGLTRQILATVNPSNATDKTIKWSVSNNSTIATVDSSTGLVTAKTQGECTIVATANDASKISVSCKVIVKNNLSFDTNGNYTIYVKNDTQNVSSVAITNNYIVKTKADLLLFKEIVENGYTSINVKMLSNIDLANTIDNQWASISSTYNGVFNGGGFSINNYYSNAGLFDKTSNTSKILAVRINGTISTNTLKSNIGSIVNDNSGIINSCISNVSISNTYTDHIIGGICGLNETTGDISNCINKGNITTTATNKTNSNAVGGICGTNNLNIRNCTNVGEIKGTYIMGGIVGYNTGKIEFCNNAGNALNTSVEHDGAICGLNGSTISKCVYLDGTGGITDSTNEISYPLNYSYISTLILHNSLVNNQYVFDYLPLSTRFSASSITATSKLYSSNSTLFGITKNTTASYSIDATNGYIYLKDDFSGNSTSGNSVISGEIDGLYETSITTTIATFSR
jgi:uncharacterized protein YjdB